MKQIIKIIIVIIMILIILTGCNKIQKDKNTEKTVSTTIEQKIESTKEQNEQKEPVEENIIGVWNCVLSDEEFNESYTFNIDGSYFYEIGTDKEEGMYTLENNILKLKTANSVEEVYEITFNYEKKANNKIYDLVFINPETDLVEIELEKS